MKLNRIIISFAIGILITNIVGIAINIIYGTTENYLHTAAGLNKMHLMQQYFNLYYQDFLVYILK